MISSVADIVSYLLVALGSVALLCFRSVGRSAIGILGWACIVISAAVFTAGYSSLVALLSHVTELQRTATVFVGTAFFNKLFVLGAIGFTAGVPAVLVNELFWSKVGRAKPILWTGIVATTLGLVDACLVLVNLGNQPTLAISIAIGSVVMLLFGIQILWFE